VTLIFQRNIKRELGLNPKLYPQLYAKKLVVIYYVTFRYGEGEGKQQDASQETCHFTLSIKLSGKKVWVWVILCFSPMNKN
jgi:hypothetical protein